MASTVFLSALDSVAKWIGASVPIWELVWVRNAFQVGLAFAVFAPRLGRGLLVSRAPRLQLLRSTALLGSTTLYFLALRHLPLAETAAITFAAPLITVVLAGPVLGERVAKASLAAALLGFAGVVAVIQPFSGAVQPAMLLPLAAAVTSSVYTLLTRALRERDHAATTWFYSGMVGFVVTSFTPPTGWVVPTEVSVMVPLLAIGVCASLGHLLLISAYGRATASALAPLGYLELLWVTIVGLTVFGELPNALGLAGIGLIAAAGIVTTRFERPVSPAEGDAELAPAR